ncbi:MAG: hypothetical protein ABSG64_10750 [Solirubrobacteraceae bacterium]|jgi:hypothetical protein
MGLRRQLSDVFGSNSIEALERKRDYARLVRKLAKTESDKDEHEIEEAIKRLGDVRAAGGLIKLVIDRCRMRHEVLEVAKTIENQAISSHPLGSIISQYGSVMMSGPSPAAAQHREADSHSSRASAALRCLDRLKASDAIKAALADPSLGSKRAPYIADVRDRLERTLRQIERT